MIFDQHLLRDKWVYYYLNIVLKRNFFIFVIDSFFDADSESEICFSRSPLVFELQ